jgi:hypothetical protein
MIIAQSIYPNRKVRSREFRKGPPQETPGWEYSSLIMGENPGEPAFFMDILKT